MMALIECPDCHKEVSDKAVYCPSCGYPFKPGTTSTPSSDIPGHGVPALFSFFIPGLGQLMKGDILGAISPYVAGYAAFMIFTEISYRVLALGVIWVVQLIDTYRVKKKVDWAGEFNKLNQPIKGSKRACGIITLVFALLITVSLLSYGSSDRSFSKPSGNVDTDNWLGVVGAYLADFLFQGFGYAAYFLPLLLIVSSYHAFRDSYAGSRFVRAIGYVGILLSVAILSSLSFPNRADAGGIVGGVLGEYVLFRHFGQIGAYAIAIILLGVSIIFVVQPIRRGPVEPHEDSRAPLSSKEVLLFLVSVIVVILLASFFGRRSDIPLAPSKAPPPLPAIAPEYQARRGSESTDVSNSAAENSESSQPFGSSVQPPETNASQMGEFPSCTEVVRSRSSLGASPPCAPRIIDNDAALQAVKKAEKISYRYYVFLTEREWQSVSYKDRWNFLALLVCAIQSLYDENSDVFFVVTPASDLEKTLLTLGQYPKNKLKAHGRYMMAETISLSHSGKEESFPPGHKKRLYTLIVY